MPDSPFFTMAKEITEEFDVLPLQDIIEQMITKEP